MALVEIPVPVVRLIADLGRQYVRENTLIFDGAVADCRQCHADLLLGEPHDDTCPVRMMTEFLETL